jgi:hypothetical protein
VFYVASDREQTVCETNPIRRRETNPAHVPNSLVGPFRPSAVVVFLGLHPTAVTIFENRHNVLCYKTLKKFACAIDSCKCEREVLS